MFDGLKLAFSHIVDNKVVVLYYDATASPEEQIAVINKASSVSIFFENQSEMIEAQAQLTQFKEFSQREDSPIDAYTGNVFSKATSNGNQVMRLPRKPDNRASLSDIFALATDSASLT